MRTTRVLPPSFPEAAANEGISPAKGVQWQVLCGDPDHWRVGLYSPSETAPGEVRELERHDCPELFVLLEGRLTLLLVGPDGLRELPLEKARPVLVTTPHSGYCPQGPHTGVALVVERDAFETEYRSPIEWMGGKQQGATGVDMK